MGNPYMGNSFLEGVGGFMAGQAAKKQQEQAKAAAAYQRQRQQAIDTADIGYKNAQTQYLGVQGDNLTRQTKLDVYKAFSDNQDKLLGAIPKISDWAKYQSPEIQQWTMGLIENYRKTGTLPPMGLDGMFGGGGSPAPPTPQGQSALYGTGPLGTPLNAPSPMGGNAGDLGGPARPANMGSGNLGGPATPANMGSGNLGGPPAPSGPPRPPFTGMMQPPPPQPPQGGFWQQNVAAPTGRSLLDGLANLPGLEWNAPAPMTSPGSPPQGQPMPRPQGPSAPLVQPVNAPPQVQGGVTRYPYRTPSGEVLYATRDEANGAIDWSKQQPYQDKIADVELLRSAGKTSANDAWDPYYVNLARSLKGATPEARLQEFESAVARSGRKIVKFPSDASDYQQFAQSQGVNTGQTQQGQPQQPTNGKIFSLSPEDKVAMSKIPLNEAETRNADARTKEIYTKMGDPTPFFAAVEGRPKGSQRAFVESYNDSHGTHFPVPGVDFRGIYGADIKTAADLAKLVAETENLQQKTDLLVPEFKQKVKHEDTQDYLTGQGQQVTMRGQDKAAETAANRLNFDRDKYNAFSPEKQAYITSQQKRLAATQAVITKAQEDINHALASPITPIAQKVIIDLAMSRKQAAEAQQKTIQSDIDRQFGGGQQQSSGVGVGKAGSIPVAPTPMGDKIGATAQAMQKSGAANQPHYCERVARQTYQQNTHAYDRYWGDTAKSTVGNFRRAGIAKPYTPGMQIPGGSLLYSTNGENGHVQVADNNGVRYDQYGKNQKFPPSYFQYYVPPPGVPPVKQQTASAGKAISGRAPSGVNFTYTP
jgi:hypothetical protein